MSIRNWSEPFTYLNNNIERVIMDSDKIQSLWDDCLIRGWKSDLHMTMIVKQFLVNVNPDLLRFGYFDTCGFKDVGDVVNYINSLEIRRRCRDRAANDGLEFHGLKSGVRAFIARRSPMLSNCLLTGKSSNDEILAAIHTFKWTRVQEKNNSAERQRNKRKYVKASGVREIKARSLGKNHDWGTVK